MSFFDNLKETAKNLGEKAAETATDLKDKASDKIEIEKLNKKIRDAEGDIKDTYAAIGKKIFEEHPDYLDKFFTEEKGKIEELKANIAAFGEKIEAVKNTVGKVVEGAKDEVEEKAEDVKEAVEEVKDKIEESL